MFLFQKSYTFSKEHVSSNNSQLKIEITVGAVMKSKIKMLESDID